MENAGNKPNITMKVLKAGQTFSCVKSVAQSVSDGGEKPPNPSSNELYAFGRSLNRRRNNARQDVRSAFFSFS